MFEVRDSRIIAGIVDDLVNSAFVAVGEAKDGNVEYNPRRIRSRNPEEPGVMECLDQLRKSLLGDQVMLFAGDSAIAETLIIDVSPFAEIDAESRTTQTESIAFRIGKDDVVEIRPWVAS